MTDGNIYDALEQYSSQGKIGYAHVRMYGARFRIIRKYLWMTGISI